MAIIHPHNLSLSDVREDHGSAESYIIEQINKLDPIKTKDWVFYYSFSFKSKTLTRMKDCEIDFLCLLPDIGVFVFEIKGGSISKVTENDETVYYSTNKNETVKIINPYSQAKGNYYDLSNLLKHIPIDSGHLYITDFVGGYAVGFPDPKMTQLPFSDPLSGEGANLTYLHGKDLYSFFTNLGNYYKQDKKRVPSKNDIDVIIKCLLQKDFTYKNDIGSYLDTVNVRINQLTDEQFVVLKGLLNNDRCLINGPAGSGKTILSEMLFKYFLTNHEKVAYFSFNIFNSQKVKSDLDIAMKATNSICAPLYEYVEEQLKILNPQFDILNDRNNALDALLACKNDARFPKFDVLIIDEAQDLPGDQNIIDLFDCLSKKSLTYGKVFVFYDDYQTLFENGRFYANEIFGVDYARYAKFYLNNNCRNARNISNALNTIRDNPDNTVTLKSLICPNIHYESFNDPIEAVNRTYEIIKDLKSNGVKAKSISILLASYGIKTEGSPINTALKMMAKNNLGIKDYALENKNVITYTTINKFKGLENDIIIYLRCYKNYRKTASNTDYVAISRGRAIVYIVDIIQK